ncbi:MAG: GNAT family N-acetyltransferase [Agriterribacter sp.]
MKKFYNADQSDFEDLLALTIDFEFDKDIVSNAEFKPDEKALRKERRADLKNLLADKTCNYIVCNYNKQLAAYIFVGYNTTYKGEGYIYELYVVPQFRKKGIAKKLLEKGVQWLKKNGCTSIDITVNRKNKAALLLYQGSSFQKQKSNYISLRWNICIKK